MFGTPKLRAPPIGSPFSTRFYASKSFVLQNQITWRSDDDLTVLVRGRIVPDAKTLNYHCSILIIIDRRGETCRIENKTVFSLEFVSVSCSLFRHTFFPSYWAGPIRKIQFILQPTDAKASSAAGKTLKPHYLWRCSGKREIRSWSQIFATNWSCTILITFLRLLLLPDKYWTLER